MAAWEQSSLGGACDMIKRGIAPKYAEEGGICVLNQKCIRDHDIDFSLARRHDMSRKRVSEERIVRPGDVLVNSTGVGTLGRVAQVRAATAEPTTVDTHVTIVRPKPGLFYRDFFGYMLIRIEDEIASSGEGASGQTELARKTLSDRFQVQYPGSLPEQKRIVAILDEAFAAIATATTNAEKNLANARELFESQLNRVFSEKGDGWVEKRVAQLGKVTSSKRIFKREYTDTGIPFYRTKEIKERAHGRDITTELFISVERYNEIKQKFGVPLPGDILLTAIGTIGEIFVVDGQEEFYFKDGNVLWLKEFESVNSDFLRYVLMSFVETLRRLSHGSAYNALPIQRLKNHMIYLPPADEQRHIVARLDALQSRTHYLEPAYEQRLTALAELKQSILHKAFGGELTANPKVAERTLSEAGL